MNGRRGAGAAKSELRRRRRDRGSRAVGAWGRLATERGRQRRGGRAMAEREREVTRYITRRPEAQGRRDRLQASERRRGLRASVPQRLRPRWRQRLGAPPPPAGPGVAHLPRRPRPPCPGPAASSGLSRGPTPPPHTALAAAGTNVGEGSRSPSRTAPRPTLPQSRRPPRASAAAAPAPPPPPR